MVEQLAELAVGQLAALQPRLDAPERPPDLRQRVVRPFALGQDLQPELLKVKFQASRTVAWFPRRSFAVCQQVAGPVGGRDDGPGSQFVGGAALRRQRHRDDEGAVRELAGSGANGPHQRLRADDELGRPGHQRKQQDPGPELVGQVPELAELPLAERPPGRERQHRGTAELGPHVGRPPAKRAEGPVLGRPQRGDRSRQPEHVARAVGGGPFADLDHGQRRPLRVLQNQPAASAGTALAGTVSVTGIGHGVPSASSPLAATADRSSAVR